MPISEVYNGDNLLLLKKFPDAFFDLVIDDPPYGLGLDMVTKVDSNNRQGRKNRVIVKHDEKDWNNNIPTPDYFYELHRVSRHQIIWGCNYYAQYIPAVGRIVHDKIMGTENTAFNWSHADLASCSLFKRIVMFRYQWAGNKQNGSINWKNEGQDARIHPTQKPLSLYRFCLGFAKPGWKILDPHMGSQGSRIVAHSMGFDYWGFERDKDYFEKGNKRFNELSRQLQLL